MTELDETHAPDASSWLENADGHPDFPVQNLPLGIFRPKGEDRRRAGIAIGDHILDVGAITDLYSGTAKSVAETAHRPALNALFSLPSGDRRQFRRETFRLLTEERHRERVSAALHQAADCELFVPFEVGDYTDFYTGIQHATNVGSLFRPDNPLLPNYKHVPIGYHGRASSIRVSGTEFRRPRGQLKAPDAVAPEFAPCRRLDYELEVGVWVAGHNELGEPVDIANAHDRIAGLCLLNDWSARDIQAWEYQPLGPFLSKNFLTTVSPWVVTSEALAPFRTAQPPRPEGDPAPLDYLMDAQDQATGAFDVSLEVLIRTRQMKDQGLPPHRLSSGNMTSMYWTAAQLVAHHTCGGCNLATGDLLGTGTLSGADKSSFGSLLELSAGGKEPISLPSGESRTFLEDGDEVMLAAFAETPGRARIGFGPCGGTVSPAP